MTMEIHIRQLAGEKELGDVIRWLWNPKTIKPSAKIWDGNDSILQIPLWIAFCVVPRSVYLQLATHRKKDFFYPWCASARPDIDPTAAKEYSREQPVKCFVIFSARSAIEISHLRLCRKAEQPTRKFVSLWKDELEKLGDTASVQTARHMMPMCAYRNGLCTEMRSCGHPQPWPFRKESEK